MKYKKKWGNVANNRGYEECRREIGTKLKNKGINWVLRRNLEKGNVLRRGKELYLCIFVFLMDRNLIGRERLRKNTKMRVN